MPPRNLCTDARTCSLRRHRFAIATAGLATAALVLVPRVDHALAVPLMVRGDDAARRVATRAAADLTTSTSAVEPVVPGQEAVVEIPSLELSLPVVRGGQGVIDEGVVAHYSESRARPAVDPGMPGTYWLAAHSSTHGSPFGQLPAIADGAQVRVKTLGGVTFTYTITSLELVGSTTTQATVYGPDTTTPRILLQTCHGASERLLVHGVLASKSFASTD
jgi:LPXTG-site transpeptidase (sortase) family protein